MLKDGITSNISLNIEIVATGELDGLLSLRCNSLCFHLALFFYEYFLTLTREIQCVWLRPGSGAAYLFLLNRYIVMANRLLRLIQAVSWHGHTKVDADRVRTNSLD